MNLAKARLKINFEAKPNFMRCIVLLTIISFKISVYGQNSGQITGKVLDNEDQPIEFVNIFITSEKDTVKIINATISDSKGIFILSDVPYGSYIINFQIIGFLKYTKKISLNGQNRQFTLNPVFLQPDVMALNEVEITAFRNMIQKTDEGLVLNASENITQIGGTASDLMKNMPGVLVGAEGEITLRGKSPQILVNNRVSGIGGIDRVANLEQIPSSSIERIEIITNPSAKYDADAESGIINIVLKENTEMGTNGAAALGAGFGDRYRINASLLFNHNTSKWNFGLAYDNWFTTRTRHRNGDRIQYDLPNEYYLTQRRSDERTVQTQTARFDIDYTPNNKNSISMEAIWLFEGQDNHETVISTTETSLHEFTGRNSRYSNEIRRFHTGEISLNYTRNFNQPDRKLTVDVSSSIDYNRENTDISTQTLSEQFVELGNPFLQKTHNYEDASISNISINYYHPVKEIGMIETGCKTILRFISTDFLRSNQLNGIFVTDSANTDIFKFNEQIYAAYLQYVGWIGDKKEPRWKYTFGIRAETVMNEGNTTYLPFSFSNQYTNFFPSASLIYYTPKKDMLSISYSRRINRPSLGNYNPFPDITDSLNIHSGNPDLQPELANSFELSFNHTFQKGNITASAFYRQTSNIILSYTTLDSNGVAYMRPENFGNSRTYGLEGILTYHLSGFWSINLDLSAYELVIEETSPSLNVLQNQFTGFAKFINNLTLWKNGRLQLTGNYTSPVAISQGERNEVYFVDLGIQQKILKGQGRLAFTFTDIFNTQESGYRISDSNFSYERISKVDSRAIMFIFAYTFKSEFEEKLLENKFKNE